MRRSLAQFSEPDQSTPSRSLADFITNMYAFRFSVHTEFSWSKSRPSPAIACEGGTRCLGSLRGVAMGATLQLGRTGCLFSHAQI
jgi:hypothetical protein